MSESTFTLEWVFPKRRMPIPVAVIFPFSSIYP
jgi:hypothetical protein